MRSTLMRGIAALAVLAAFGATSAHAAPSLTFEIAIGASPATGTVSFLGGTSNPLTGTNIQVPDVFSSGPGTDGGDPTPLNPSTTLMITSGLLNFTTGNYTGSTTDGSGFLVDLFAAGGSLTLTGGLTTPAIPNGSNLLFNGGFTGPTSVTFGSNGADLIGAVHLTNINATLATYFGLPVGVDYNGNLGLNFRTVGTIAAGAAFTSTRIQGGQDIVTATPEPGTVAMAFSALPILGLVWMRRRKQQA